MAAWGLSCWILYLSPCLCFLMIKSIDDVFSWPVSVLQFYVPVPVSVSVGDDWVSRSRTWASAVYKSQTCLFERSVPERLGINVPIEGMLARVWPHWVSFWTAGFDTKALLALNALFCASLRLPLWQSASTSDLICCACRWIFCIVDWSMPCKQDWSCCMLWFSLRMLSWLIPNGFCANAGLKMIKQSNGINFFMVWAA